MALLDKVIIATEVTLKKTSEIFEMTAKKSGDVVEQARIQFEIKKKEEALDKAYMEIGKLFYDVQVRKSVVEEATFDAQFSTVTGLINEISEMKKKVAELSNKCICHSCGADNPIESLFCSKCGVAQIKDKPCEPAEEPSAEQCGAAAAETAEEAPETPKTDCEPACECETCPENAEAEVSPEETTETEAAQE